MKVLLQNVRIAFCQNLWEPGGEFNRCDAQFIFPPKQTQPVRDQDGKIVLGADGEPKRILIAKLLDDAIEKTAMDQPKWKGKHTQILAKILKDGNCCFSKEDYLDKNGDPYDGFAGMYHIRANNKVRPLVIDRDKSPLTASDGRPYAGCYVNAQIDIWSQDNSYGRRINASLSGVQFLKDGDAFTGGQPADPDDFDNLSDTGAEEDDLVA